MSDITAGEVVRFGDCGPLISDDRRLCLALFGVGDVGGLVMPRSMIAVSFFSDACVSCSMKMVISLF